MKALELLYKENFEKNITDLCTEVSKAVGDSQHKKAWDLINRLNGRKSRSYNTGPMWKKVFKMENHVELMKFQANF